MDAYLSDPPFEKLSEADKEYFRLAAEFGHAHFTDENIRQWMLEGGMPDSVLEEFRDSGLGYISLNISGSDKQPASFFCQTLILEELSRLSGTILPINSLISTFSTLSLLATPDQIDFALDVYKHNPQPFFSFALSNNSGSYNSSNPQSTATVVERKNDQLVMNGLKPFVNNAEYAPYILAFARNCSDVQEGDTVPYTYWLVPKSSTGVSIYPFDKAGQRLFPAAAIQFNNVPLNESLQLGHKNIDWAKAAYATSSTRVVNCANSLGMAEAVMEDVAYYAGAHRVDGKLLVELGQIDEKLADMQFGLVSARHLLYRTAMSLQEHRSDAEQMTNLVTRYVPRLATRIANDGIAILGGIGYTDLSRVSRIWIDCRGNELAVGSPEVMARLIARDTVKHYHSELNK